MRPPLPPLPIAFGAFGLVWGAWQAVLPDLAARFGLSTGPLGLMLTAGFAVSLPVMLLTGRLIDRFGAGRMIAITGLALAIGLAMVGTLASLPVLVLGVICFAAGSGAFDVGINAAALGATFVVPEVVSLAAARAGSHAGRAASYVLTLGYAGFLVGPSLVGVLGELAGLRVALVVVPIAAVVIAVASRTGVARAA